MEGISALCRDLFLLVYSRHESHPQVISIRIRSSAPFLVGVGFLPQAEEFINLKILFTGDGKMEQEMAG